MNVNLKLNVNVKTHTHTYNESACERMCACEYYIISWCEFLSDDAKFQKPFKDECMVAKQIDGLNEWILVPAFQMCLGPC